tara:strand:+ start:601 stop:1221 length:621 start_codon:yes stop_codon:yes gene_type:complete
MLTDGDLRQLAVKMSVPLEYVGFKDELPRRLKANKAYIINLENEENGDGENNTGSHWTCFFVRQYPNGKKEAIYFDPFGFPPPEIVKKEVKNSFDGISLPHTKADIQSLMSNACGWYCMAFLHYIEANPLRSKDLYDDVATFMSMFLDLREKTDWKHNEWVLRHFFQAKDPALRKPIDVYGDNNYEPVSKDDRATPMGIEVGVKYV